MEQWSQETRSIGIKTPLGEDVLILIGLRGSDSLGSLFQFELDLASERADIEPGELIGKNVDIWLRVDDENKQFINGYISRFSVKGVNQFGFREYYAEFVPWVWFLQNNINCRIYQEKTAEEIIENILEQYENANFEFKLLKEHPPVEYSVQYLESDLEFISRIAHHNGIFFFFTHEEGKHTFTLIDDATNYPECLDNSVIHTEGELAKDHLAQWEHHYQFITGKWAQTDFNFTTPSTDLQSTSQTVVDLPGTDKFEKYDYPGGYNVRDTGTFISDTRMAEEELKYENVSAVSSYRSFFAGGKFTVNTHDNAAEVDKNYVVSRIFHEAYDDSYMTGGAGRKIYDNQVVLVPADRPYQHLEGIRKPIIQGPQTAIVVGPDGEEIYTDEFGRIKVSFHWDRYNEADETASCWIRVSQAWAGKLWGSVSLPRIGQEVIVSFLNGDPDRPIVTGRVYNADLMPPYELPANATMTTFKTNSSVGGGGFNEIRMEDKKDEEQIFMHAQKNMDTRVVNDRFDTIENDAHLVIGNIKKEHVKNERHETVDSHHIEKITGDRNLKVEGKEAKAVIGSLSLKVSDDVIEEFENNHSEQVTNDYFVKASNIVIEGTTNVTIKVGQSYIAIESGGIKIGSTGDIELESTGTVSVSGTSGVTVESAATVDVTSSSTTVAGDAMLTLEGGLVKIN